MDHSATYALRTYFDTYLCVEKGSNTVRHKLIDEIQDLLVAKITDAEIWFYSNCILDSEIYKKFAGREFVARWLEGGQLQIKMDGWLSAEPSGEVTADRGHPFTWETFVLVPLEDVASQVGVNIGRPTTNVLRPMRNFSIPKDLHTIYLNRYRKARTVPDLFVHHANEIKVRGSANSSRIWTMADVHDAILTWYGMEIFDAYARINPKYTAAQLDFFRYLLIYKLGGVYYDITADIQNPLDNIFSPRDGFILSHWTEEDRSHFTGLHQEVECTGQGEYQQWFVIGEAGHPYLEKVILKVLENIHCYNRKEFGVGRMGVLRTTGPIPFTTAIFKVLNEHDHKFIDYRECGLVYKKIKTRFAFDHTHYSMMDEDVIL